MTSVRISAEEGERLEMLSDFVNFYLWKTLLVSYQ